MAQTLYNSYSIINTNNQNFSMNYHVTGNYVNIELELTNHCFAINIIDETSLCYFNDNF